MEKDSKIYVAGHRGLVGSAIWQALSEKGYSNLIGRTHAELDLTDQRAVREFFAAEKPEYVFLAAAHVGGILANDTYRADFIWQNLEIQNNVIHSAWKYGVKKLLFLGSTCVYPKLAPQPIREQSLLASELEYTNEPYAIAKIAGLKLCESFNLQYGTNFLAIMPTNLYGPGDNFDLATSHVLPALLRKFHLAHALSRGDWKTVRKDLERRPVDGTDGHAPEQTILQTLAGYGISRNSVEIWGTGTPLREFLWSGDMADASVFLMENTDFKDLVPLGEREIRNTHINIGSGREIAIRDLATLIAEAVGFDGEIRFDTDKPDGTPRKLTDTTRINRLGWSAKTTLNDGVRCLYAYYAGNR